MTPAEVRAQYQASIEPVSSQYRAAAVRVLGYWCFFVPFFVLGLYQRYFQGFLLFLFSFLLQRANL